MSVRAVIRPQDFEKLKEEMVNLKTKVKKCWVGIKANHLHTGVLQVETVSIPWSQVLFRWDEGGLTLWWRRRESSALRREDWERVCPGPESFCSSSSWPFFCQLLLALIWRLSNEWINFSIECSLTLISKWKCNACLISFITPSVGIIFLLVSQTQDILGQISSLTWATGGLRSSPALIFMVRWCYEKGGMGANQMPLWRAPQATVSIFREYFGLKKRCCLWCCRMVFIASSCRGSSGGNRVIIMTLETESTQNKVIVRPSQEYGRNPVCVQKQALQAKSTQERSLCYLRCLQFMSGKNLLLKFKENWQNLKFYRKATWMLWESICSFMKHLRGVRLTGMAGFLSWCLVFPVPWGKIIKRKTEALRRWNRKCFPKSLYKDEGVPLAASNGKRLESQRTELLNPKTVSETALEYIQISKIWESMLSSDYFLL